MHCYTTHEYQREMMTRRVTAHMNASRPISNIINKENNNSRIININVSADNLPNDGVHNADFICAMSVFGQKGWEKYARTEVSWENESHKWIKPFTIGYIPNNLHLLHFDIFQITSNLYSLKHQRCIGDCEIDLTELIGTKDKRMEVALRPNTDNGISTFDSDDPPHLKIRFTDINSNIFGSFFLKASFLSQIPQKMFKPLIHFIIERDGIPIFKSEALKLQRNTIFETLELSQQLTCGDNPNESLRFTIVENSFPEIVLGTFDISLERLSTASETKINVENLEGKIIGNFVMNFIGRSCTKRIDDLKYKGVSFQSMFAIDFSAGKSVCDSYRMVLNEIGDWLNPIAQHKPYIAFGFGETLGCPHARQHRSNENLQQYDEKPLHNDQELKKSDEEHNKSDEKQQINGEKMPTEKKMLKRRASRIFSIAAKGKEGTFQSIQQIMSMYQEKLVKCVTPISAKLTPVIRHAKGYALEKWMESKIFTLLTIITDGNVTDLEKALNTLAGCEDVPMGVIFVTRKSNKNVLGNTLAALHGKARHTENKELTKRRVFKLLYYANSFVDQPTNLRKVRSAAVKMIQNWAEAHEI